MSARRVLAAVKQFKNGALLFVLGGLLLTPLKSLSAPYPSRKLASENTEERKMRLAHARELLGKYYKHSVVKTGERVADVGDFVLDTLKAGLPDEWEFAAAKIKRTLLKESERYRLDPIFLIAVIENESSFDPKAKGSVGEIGLMQLRPATARWICKKYDIHWRGTKSLYDPVTNIKIGAAFFDYLRSDFEKHGRLYLAAYNMGQRHVRKALDSGVWPKDYVIRVMERYIRLYTELNELTTEQLNGQKS